MLWKHLASLKLSAITIFQNSKISYLSQQCRENGLTSTFLKYFLNSCIMIIVPLLAFCFVCFVEDKSLNHKKKKICLSIFAQNFSTSVVLLGPSHFCFAIWSLYQDLSRVNIGQRMCSPDNFFTLICPYHEVYVFVSVFWITKPS